jgi:2-polyprenyl-6-methoxyphenol hydroxylase-like FAD-dependent oxidoreductase
VEIVSVRCQVLERLLSKVLVALGATLLMQTQYLCHAGQPTNASGSINGALADDCPLPRAAQGPMMGRQSNAQPHVLALAAGDASTGGSSASRELQLPFDLLIAADGGNSAVRRQSGIPFEEREAFSAAWQRMGAEGREDEGGGGWQQDGAAAGGPSRALPTTVIPGLRQATLIMNFEPLPDPDPVVEGAGAAARTQQRRCPPLRTVGGGSGEPQPLDPFYPSFDPLLRAHGVTAVFKRFFGGYCQLQVLFSEAGGARVLKVYAAHEGLWEQERERDVAVLRAVAGSEGQGGGAAPTNSWTNSSNSTAREVPQWQQAALPWPIMQRVCNLLLSGGGAGGTHGAGSQDGLPCASVQQLQDLLAGSRSAQGRVLSARVLSIRIRSVESDTHVLTHERRPLSSDPAAGAPADEEPCREAAEAAAPAGAVGALDVQQLQLQVRRLQRQVAEQQRQWEWLHSKQQLRHRESCGGEASAAAGSQAPVTPAATSSSSASAVLLLVGDAACTAHYRLGVGVNNAFRSLPELRGLVHAMAAKAPESAQGNALAGAVARKRALSTGRMRALVQYQLAVRARARAAAASVLLPPAQNQRLH